MRQARHSGDIGRLKAFIAACCSGRLENCGGNGIGRIVSD